MNPEWFAFVETAKKQGEIRFSGIAGHGGNLIRCLDIALEKDLVDVITMRSQLRSGPRVL